MTYQIESKPVVNFMSGRAGQSPVAIVSHIMQGTMGGTYSWFNNQTAKVSAHFGVGRDGSIWQFVNEGDTAWANGVELGYNGGLDWLNTANTQSLNPNWLTLSIEHEGYTNGSTGHGYADNPNGPFTDFPEAQYQATLWLHRYLLAKYPEITIDHSHLIGHFQIDPGERSYCPGLDFPWARLIGDLNGQGQLRDSLLTALYAAAGQVYHPEWATHQAAIRWQEGFPLAADTHVTVNGQDYVGEVYPKDVIFYPYGQWNNIQRLNDLATGDPLRGPLTQLAYSARQIPANPAQAFYQYADSANSPGGHPLGTPLSDQFEIMDNNQNKIAVLQIFALDTIYTPIANPETNTNWGDVRRYSALVGNLSPEDQAFRQTLSTTINAKLGVNPDLNDPLYQKGLALGYGTVISTGLTFNVNGKAGSFAIFGGGVTWHYNDGSGSGTLADLSGGV